MIIDCHGHYTTSPPQHEAWRAQQIAALKDGGHDDIRFVLRRFTRAEHCRRVRPWFVVEVAIANVQVDVHSLSPPFLTKCCRLSGKVGVGRADGLFGFVRADLDELVRIVPLSSSVSDHRTAALSPELYGTPLHPHSRTSSGEGHDSVVLMAPQHAGDHPFRRGIRNIECSKVLR